MPKIHIGDTIAALATPAGPSALALIRLSGPDAIKLADALFRPRKGRKILAESLPFSVRCGFIVDGSDQPIDEVLVTVFRAPRSYTAEDMVEISCHGGIAVTRRILERFYQAGARPADPGEFTRRAFMNGRMDLAQAEAVLDVIQAKTDANLRAAEEQLAGRLSEHLGAIKGELMNIYAHVEACVDFPQEDIETYGHEDLAAKLGRVRSRLRVLADSYRQGQIAREGVLAVIIGRPNVGKSSLLNALLDRPRAIVSDVPGTTRDTLEESAQLEGILFRLVDTAGWGPVKDKLDALAIERTRQLLERGTVLLLVLDGSEPLRAEDREIAALAAGKQVIPVINKSDLKSRWDWDGSAPLKGAHSPVRVSAKTGEGLGLLTSRLKEQAGAQSAPLEGVFITRLRHKDAVEKALTALNEAQPLLAANASAEFISIHIRQALAALAELTGEASTDDLLDVIFREFCIGK